MTAATVIMNPAAGREAQTPRVRQWCAEHPEVVLKETSARGDADRMVREAAASGVDLVVSAGGDGTLHEVVGGLMQCARRPRLAILPLGTGNDFARSVGLGPAVDPALTLLEAAMRHEARLRRIDLIRVETAAGQRWCINMATGGFSAVVRRAMTRKLKRFLGPLAYAFVACRCLWQIPHYRVEVVADGESHRARTPSVCLANGRFVAGGLEIAPQAILDDGVMDLMIFRPQTLRARVGLIGSYLLRRGHLHSPHTTYRQVASATVRSVPAMHFIADGEDIGATPMTFTLTRGAIELVVPAEPARTHAA